MNKPKLYNLSQAGTMLGLTRQTFSEVAEKMGIEAPPMGLPGRARGVTMAEIRRVGRALGVKPNAELVSA